jgi:hypothetical protein
MRCCAPCWPCECGGSFVEIGPHENGIANGDSRADHAAQADNTVLDHGALADLATIGDETGPDRGVINLRRRQVAGSREDRRFRAIQLEKRIGTYQAQIGIIKGFDRANVFPVPVKHVDVDMSGVDRLGEDLLAKVLVTGVHHQIDEQIAVEQVDPHVGQAIASVGRHASTLEPLGFQANRLQQLFRLWFLDESGHASRRVRTHNPQSAGRAAGDGKAADGYIGLGVEMRLEQLAVIHAVQLVAGQDQDIVHAGLLQVTHVLADGVGGALIPIGAFVHGLLRGQQLDETTAEVVELIGLANVAVQANGQELGQDIDAVDTAVQAIRERNIDQTVLACQGHRGLGAILGQRIQACPPTTTEHERYDVSHDELPSGFLDMGSTTAPR